MTGLYGVIGDPIAQSLSPLIHKGWMRDNHLDADYVAMHVLDGDLPNALKTLADKGCQGLNITSPHKLVALTEATELTPEAKTIGAANTLWLDGNGGWGADNTDARGFMAALGEVFEPSVQGKSVTVLGAGGASRAVVYALDAAGANILLANRTVSKAETILQDYYTGKHRAVSLEIGLEEASDAELVVNTASLGFSGGALEFPKNNDGFFYDISYGKGAADTLSNAAINGWTIADGLSMLVHQAAFSFERWFGIKPDTAKAMERVRRVVGAT